MRIPKGVEIRKIGEKEIYVRGEQGIQKAIVPGVEVIGERIEVESQIGRDVVKKMIQGVTTGYRGKIKIQGVGYRAREEKGEVGLTIGYKDEKIVKIPQGVEIKIEGNGTIIRGKSGLYTELRQSLSKIVEKRPARKDRYKGKGIVE